MTWEEHYAQIVETRANREMAGMPPLPKMYISFSGGRTSAVMTKRLWEERPRSACVYCPHHDNAEWRRIRDEEPESWARAVEFDTKVRTGIHGVKQACFVHRQCVPLEEVDLSEDDAGLLWGNECEGMCGV